MFYSFMLCRTTLKVFIVANEKIGSYRRTYPYIYMASRIKYSMRRSRTICPVCEERLIAIAYLKYGREYYRDRCSVCYRAKKPVRPKAPGWAKTGYKKKPHCEKCGFHSKHKEQLVVYYIDGNVLNNDWFNLKTICLNCEVDIKHSILPWKPSVLVPDF